MRYKLIYIISSLVLIFNVFGLKPQPDEAASSISFNVVDLQPAWTMGNTGLYGDRARIQVADFNQDGVVDVATCGNGHLYVLNQTNPGVYETIWFGEFLNCKQIAIGDRDSNGFQELYVATWDAHVVVVDGDDFGVVANIKLSSIVTPYQINDIGVGDVDSDGAQEIVITSLTTTLVYNASTFAIEWQANGYGGNQLGIGNIDNDALLEIVVNGTPAHVLNASQKKQEWAYESGFGTDMSIDMSMGDVDGDGRAEIAFIVNSVTFSNRVYLVDGDTQAVKWIREGDLGYLFRVFIADMNGDGLGEVMVGSDQGKIVGLQGSTGTNLWSLPGTLNTFETIGAGDVNGDGVTEILWGEREDPSRGGLYIASWVTQTILWHSERLVGIVGAHSGDIDLDGQVEIVMAYSLTNGGASNGIIRVFDGATHQVEWSSEATNYGYICDIAIAQLDLDPALEILVKDVNMSRPRLTVYDGITHAVEWESPDLGSYYPLPLMVEDVDDDGVDEIIVALFTDHVQIFDGASNTILWDSGDLGTLIFDMSLGDVDGNGELDLAILTYDHMFVYEAGTWIPTYSAPVLGGKQLAISNADIGSQGELLLVTSDGTNYTLQCLDGKSFAPKFQRSLGTVVLIDLIVTDIDDDHYNEYIFMGYEGPEDFMKIQRSSVLAIGTRKYPFFWKYQMNASWGAIQNISIADLDNDGQTELLISTNTIIQVNELIRSEKVIHQAFLSMLRKPRGIYGTVTDKDVPAPNVSLALRFYNGSTWSTLAQTTTGADGSYLFMGVPSLSAGQAYYVLFQNTQNGNPQHLWTWHTKSITSYGVGDEVHLGDFDLADVSLNDPYDGQWVTLPYTFYWSPRLNRPGELCEFNLFDPYDGDPYFWIGNVINYPMTNLPAGFRTGQMYVWEIWVYAPDGGFGISYDVHRVYFNNAGPNVSVAAQPLKSRIIPDLEIQRDR